MEVAFGLCQNTQKSKSLSYQTKLGHYGILVEIEILYGAEAIDKHFWKWKRKEIDFLAKILAPKSNSKRVFLLEIKQELYEKFAKILTEMKGRRLDYYWHIIRMEPEIISNEILLFQKKRKAQSRQVRENHQDIKQCGIWNVRVGNIEVCRKKVSEVKHFSKVTANQKEQQEYSRKEKVLE